MIGKAFVIPNTSYTAKITPISCPCTSSRFLGNNRLTANLFSPGKVHEMGIVEVIAD
jgi:hypothetical protein